MCMCFANKACIVEGKDFSYALASCPIVMNDHAIHAQQSADVSELEVRE